MNDITPIFFELIRVAIGNQSCLSHTPSAEEWGELYAMAKKQSLVGVCFAGVQKTLSNSPSKGENWNMPEQLYLQWMGMAAKIQQRNEVMNRQCVELQQWFASKDFRSCVLKGQGVAALYAINDLSELRQSGDIDIWVDGERDAIIRTVSALGCAAAGDASVKHWPVQMFPDTEVEIHFRPSWFYNPIHDIRLKKWLTQHREKQFCNPPVNGIVAPTDTFNLVFLMIHLYRHLFEEGFGLRQLMDYYMVLSSTYKSSGGGVVPGVKETLDGLGILRFSGAILWIVDEVFAHRSDGHVALTSILGIEKNEKEGRFLLEEVMLGGNFGKYDTRQKASGGNRITRGLTTMRRNMRFIIAYPSEIVWSPFWKVWHWGWRKMHGYI